MAKHSIRETIHGNWYGYAGNKRVEMFMGTNTEQEQKARQWLKDQHAAQGGDVSKEPTVSFTSAISQRVAY